MNSSKTSIPDAFLPAESRPHWQALPEFGILNSALASFSGYLAGSEPMTDTQLQDGCKVMDKFPNAKSKDYEAINNFLQKELQRRYRTADPEERDKIEWISTTLLLRTYGERFRRKFNYHTKELGEAHDDQFYFAIRKAVAYALNSPLDPWTPALLQKASTFALRELTERIMGNDESAFTADRRALLLPASLDAAMGDTDMNLADVIPATGMGPLNMLLAKEAEAGRVNLRDLLSIEGLRPKQIEVLREYNRLIESGENPTLGKVGESMGCTAERVRQILGAISKATPASFVERFKAQIAEPERGLHTR